MLPCFKEKAIAQLLDFNKYTKKKNRQTHPSLSIFLFIFTCVVVAFCPVNPLNFLLHFYAIGVWIRSENRWVLFCPVFYKSQCFQASAAFITEAEILMKSARIRRYLISFVLILLRFSLIFKRFQRLASWLLHHFYTISAFGFIGFYQTTPFC